MHFYSCTFSSVTLVRDHRTRRCEMVEGDKETAIKLPHIHADELEDADEISLQSLPKLS